MKLFRRCCLLLLCLSISWQTLPAQNPTPGQSVNMVSGTTWPYGDPFLERQDEPSLAVSTRNSLHLLAGANDYRSVDLNLPEAEPGEVTAISAPAGTGEPWVGQYMSVDGGARWQSTLLHGYPQDPTCQTASASPLCGFTTAADPVIAAGTNGLFYYAGIAFNRGESKGLVFVARFMDLSNREGTPDISKDTFPIRYIDTIPVAFGTNNIPAHFLDKPAVAVDIPRGNNTCNFVVPQGSGLPAVPQSNIPAGNVYVAYADVSSSGGNQISTIYFSRSTNCGATWSAPVAISRGYQLSQGATIQIDPETGIVYVAWRVIHSAQQPKDGIAIAASLDGGRNFFPAITLVSLPPFNPASPTPSFFDQNTSFFSFRTTAYPALAVGDSGIPFLPGPLYLAWSQRIPSSANPTMLDTKIMMLAIPGNASFSSSGFKPPTPFPLDNGQITNDAGGVFNLTTGFQLMPAMTFNQGKLSVLYYDLRQDHTIGQFTPSVMNDKFVPDAEGNFFEEDRFGVNEAPTAAYSPYFISDAGLTVRRHTIDVVLAQANASLSVPNFAYARVSRYDMGLFVGENSGENAPFHQLKFDPPNLPMFIKGTGAFMGDYLAVAGQPFALVKCGGSQCWTYNNPSPPWVAGTFLAASKPAPTSAVHYVSWTSNQDVIPPLNGDWATYKPITGTPPAPSVYNGTPTEGCQPDTGFEGDRNQNVYSSRITQGLAISSPQSSKPLSQTVERGFVILVQNHTNGRSTANGLVNYFRMTIANQPVNGFASFAQFVPPGKLAQSAPPFPGFNRLTSIDVGIAPHTGVARTLFAASSNPLASILVNVTEIDGLGPTAKTIPGGLSGFILLNADGTVPTSLVDPNGNNGADGISGVELYNPNVSAPNVSAPNVSAPNVSAPNVSAPNVSAPNVSAPNVSAPNVSAPNVSAYSAANPNVSAPNVSAPNVSAASPSDGTYTVTNDGNTTASYKVALVGSTSTPLQLLASQIYMTPQTDGKCNLVPQQQNITLANVPNAPVVSPDQLGNPNVSAAPPTETTIAIGPHDTVYFSVRADVTPDALRQILSQNVALELQPHAIASNDTQTTTPPVVGQLFITTTTLPNAVVGQPYNQTVSAIGGVTNGIECFGYFWTWFGAFEGPTPPGLNISSTGVFSVISGTPTQPGTYNVIVEVGDCGGHTATRQFTLTVLGVPDLIVESLTHSPTQPTTVDLITVTAVVRNIGNGTAGPSNLRLQIGGETFPPPIAVPSLAPGAAFTATRQAVLNVAQGYINTATADSTNVVAESNEQNNTLTDQFVVTAPIGNLTFVTQPNVSSVVNTAITPPVQVRALDNTGAAIPGATITLSLGNPGTGPGGGTLSGTLSQLTDQTGTATFANLAIDQPGAGYALAAQAQGVAQVSSSSFNVAPITPVFIGQATDPAGDSLGGLDLVSASITVFNNDTVTLSVRYAPGTFDPATTTAEFTLDIDQNVQTGLPGIDGGCSAPDSTLIGTDYLVDLNSNFANNQGSILASGSNSCPPQFALVGNAPVTIQTNGMDMTLPLATLTGATAGAAPRGPWNFKVTTSMSLGNGGFTAILDRMPNTGLPPAPTVQQ